jgi:hypothetical protein
MSAGKYNSLRSYLLRPDPLKQGFFPLSEGQADPNFQENKGFSAREGPSGMTEPELLEKTGFLPGSR